MFFPICLKLSELLLQIIVIYTIFNFLSNITVMMIHQAVTSLK